MEYDHDAMDVGDKASEDERKIFVGGLSRMTTETDMRAYFCKFGGIEKSLLKIDPMTGNSRGFGFILFDSVSGLQKAFAQSNHRLQGKEIDVNKAIKHKPESSLKLFIGGLHPSVPEKDIRAHFAFFGNIEEIALPYDKEKGERKYFAFIKYTNEESINAALANNDSKGKQQIKNHTPVDVSKVDAKKDGKHGAAKRGRGGRGRGGFGQDFAGRGGFGMGYGFGGQGDYGGFGGRGGFGGPGGFGYDGYGPGFNGFGPGFDQGFGGRGGGFGKFPRGRGRGMSPY